MSNTDDWRLGTDYYEHLHLYKAGPKENSTQYFVNQGRATDPTHFTAYVTEAGRSSSHDSLEEAKAAVEKAWREDNTLPPLRLDQATDEELAAEVERRRQVAEDREQEAQEEEAARARTKKLAVLAEAIDSLRDELHEGPPVNDESDLSDLRFLMDLFELSRRFARPHLSAEDLGGFGGLNKVGVW